ncbi:MAG: hypothetical protein V7677_10380 [Motiliproteus sp.]
MQFSISQVAATILAVATTTSAATWYIRGDQIEVLKEQVSSYKIARDMNLESLSKNAALAIDGLNSKLESLDERNSLIEKVSEQEKSISDLKSKNELYLAKLNKLETQIGTLFSSHNEFSLKDEEHVKLFEAEYSLAINRVQSDDVIIILNNETMFLKPGKYIEIANKGIPCKLFLESMRKWSSANFSVLCEKT